MELMNIWSNTNHNACFNTIKKKIKVTLGQWITFQTDFDCVQGIWNESTILHNAFYDSTPYNVDDHSWHFKKIQNFLYFVYDLRNTSPWLLAIPLKLKDNKGGNQKSYTEGRFINWQNGTAPGVYGSSF